MTKQEQVEILNSLGFVIQNYRKKNHHVYTCNYKGQVFTIVGSSTTGNHQVPRRFKAIAQRKLREIDGLTTQAGRMN
jgi:hypothetical protein